METQVYRGVGEQFREAEWADVLPVLEPGVEWKKSVEVELFADPENSHDSNAVELRVKGVTLGFLPADDAAHFSPQLLELREKFAMVTARGSVWAIKREDRIHTNISVYLPDQLDDSVSVGATSTYSMSPRKNRLVALLLCVFLGVFGAHRFYLGKWKSGLVQLLTLGVYGIWTLIDVVLIALNKLSDTKGQLLGPWPGGK
jgi:hypothetical protein